jgi:hypothetical protein
MVASAQVYQVQTIIAIPASIMETGAAHRAARRPISELKIIAHQPPGHANAKKREVCCGEERLPLKSENLADEA